MYNTIIILNFLFYVFFYNHKYVIKKAPIIYNLICLKIEHFVRFYNFICINNPLFFDYLETNNEQLVSIKPITEKVEEKYEEKYLNKFKNFPNEYTFLEYELKEETNEYLKLKQDFEKGKIEEKNKLMDKIQELDELIENSCDIDCDGCKLMNEFGKTKLLEKFDLDEYDNFDYENLISLTLDEKKAYVTKLDECKNNVINEEDLLLQARNHIINKKLDNYINNYILEKTPLGNIYMRYNNYKKSFEYFSNNTIPYRFLEPVGRKYVMTYWCKPIFVDMESEINSVKIKNEEETKKKLLNQSETENSVYKKSKGIFAQLKNYNKHYNIQKEQRPMKNRNDNNSLIGSRIQSAMSNKQNKIETKNKFVKETANRYTHEGRFSDVCLIKKTDKKLVDKSLNLSYADFKKIHKM